MLPLLVPAAFRSRSLELRSPCRPGFSASGDKSLSHSTNRPWRDRASTGICGLISIEPCVLPPLLAYLHTVQWVDFAGDTFLSAVEKLGALCPSNPIPFVWTEMNRPGRFPAGRIWRPNSGARCSTSQESHRTSGTASGRPALRRRRGAAPHSWHLNRSRFALPFGPGNYFARTARYTTD